MSNIPGNVVGHRLCMPHSFFIWGTIFIALATLIYPAFAEDDIQTCTAVGVRAVQLDDGWVLMQDDGKILTSNRYCGGGEYSEGFISFKLCESGERRKGFVYVDVHGREEIAVDALLVGSFSGGLAPVEVSNGLWGYINKDGRLVIPAKYEDAERFSEGTAPVESGDHWQYIDTNGNVVLTLEFTPLTVFHASGFRDGAAFVVLFNAENNQYFKGILGRSGDWLIKPTADLGGPLNSGLAPMWSSVTRKLGFVDRSGNFLIAPQFSNFSFLPFEEGLAAVYVEQNSERMAGFVDKSGNWVVPPRYQEAGHFCGGLAPVRMEDKWGFINATGEFVILPRFREASSFDGGIASVLETEKGTLRPLLINRNGKVLYRSSGNGRIVSIH